MESLKWQSIEATIIHGLSKKKVHQKVFKEDLTVPTTIEDARQPQHSKNKEGKAKPSFV